MAKKRGKGRKPTGQRDDNSYGSGHIEKADMHNARLERYYKAQRILPDDEWAPFLDAMRAPLPTTFRVAGSRRTAQVLNELITTTHTPQLKGVVFEGEEVPPPIQIPWYPDGLAWQFNVPKAILRKSPEIKKFHSFLVFETEVGNISRQEAVSMIPPLLLDVEPHHRVIDMCAAPGSKTAQLLESLHAHDTLTSSSIPSGLLIANDSDNKRAHMLIHQAARLPSPALAVSNLDASIYPAVRTSTPTSSRGKAAILEFDRVLCDVPCSGDGTLRKNLAIWKRWSPMDGNGLHSLQLRILVRALRMLAPGGRLVYSTCSLNPVENEAVVASALKTLPGFELVDVSARLPGLVRRPGLTAWLPSPDREAATSFKTYDEYIDSLDEKARKEVKVSEGHWPPQEEMGLERCVRIYPHLQDTGGFFVAVLQRKAEPELEKGEAEKEEVVELGKRPAGSPAPVEAKKPRIEAAVETEDVDALMTEEIATSDGVAEAITSEVPPADGVAEQKEDASKQKKHVPEQKKSVQQTPRGRSQSAPGGGSFKEPPYTFLAPDDPNVVSCMEQLHLLPSFPASNLLVRNPAGGGDARALYLANDAARRVLQHNDYNKLRLLTAGTKLFVRQGVQWRVLSEALPVVMPYVKEETVLKGELGALRCLMEAYYPLCTSIPAGLGEVLAEKGPGNYIVRFAAEKGEGATLTHELVLPVWKSNVSACLMIEKKAKSALSLRVFGADITVAAQEAAKKKRDAKGAPVESEDVPVVEAEGELVEPVVEDGEDGMEEEKVVE